MQMRKEAVTALAALVCAVQVADPLSVPGEAARLVMTPVVKLLVEMKGAVAKVRFVSAGAVAAGDKDTAYNSMAGPDSGGQAAGGD